MTPPASDIVELLRQTANDSDGWSCGRLTEVDEAADEIERLRALLRDVAASRVILAPIAPSEMPWCLVQVDHDTWAALAEFRG